MPIIFEEEIDISVYSSENIIQDTFEYRLVTLNSNIGLDTSGLEKTIELSNNIGATINTPSTFYLNSEIAGDMSFGVNIPSTFNKEFETSPNYIGGGYFSGSQTPTLVLAFSKDYHLEVLASPVSFFSIDSVTGNKTYPHALTGIFTLLSSIDSGALSTIDAKKLSELDITT